MGSPGRVVPAECDPCRGHDDLGRVDVVVLAAVTHRLADEPAEDALDHDPSGEFVIPGALEQLHQDRVGDRRVDTAAHVGRIDQLLEVVEAVEDLRQWPLADLGRPRSRPTQTRAVVPQTFPFAAELCGVGVELTVHARHHLEPASPAASPPDRRAFTARLTVVRREPEHTHSPSSEHVFPFGPDVTHSEAWNRTSSHPST